MGADSSSGTEVKNGWRYTFSRTVSLHSANRGVFTFYTLYKIGLVIFVCHVADDFPSSYKV